ncbi:hypothetical protein DRO33_03210, partial [Candidatus Bathyarchaeota archaeon]
EKAVKAKMAESEPPPPKGLNWIWRIRAWWVRYPRGLTKEEAHKLALRLYLSGVNFALTEGHRQMLAISPEDYEASVEATRNFVEACHKFGIKVVHHATACFTTEEFIKAHPDWTQRDARTGEICFFPHYGGVWLICLNNPDFRRAYFERMLDFLKRTGCDGIMVDEVEWLPDWFSCGCKFCREKFKRETGLELPTGEDSPVWGNFKDPVWRQFLLFRMRSGGDFYADLKRQVLDKLGRPMAYLGCLAGATGTWGPRWGMSEEQFLRSHNIAFYEAEASGRPFSYFYAWQRHFAEIKYYRGAGRSFGVPVLVLFYPLTFDEARFCWALGVTCGAHIWAYRDPAESGLFDWEMEHEDLFVKPEEVADVALLFSARTRDTYRGYNDEFYVLEWVGWAEALGEANVQFSAVLDRDVERGLDPREFPLLIAPNAACLSEAEIAALRRYVEGGGTFLSTFDFSRYDETGGEREDFALADLVGARYGGEVSGEFAVEGSPLGARLDTYRGPLCIVRPLDGAEVLSWAVDKRGKRFPFVVRHRLGRGASVYIAGKVGLQGCFRGAQRGRPYPRRDHAAAKFLADLTKALVKGRETVKVEGGEGEVLVVVYKQPERGRYVVHLLNVAASRLEPGERVPEESRPVYKRLSGRAVVTLPEPVSHARLVSCDFEGEVPLRAEGRRVEIPLESLRMWAAAIADVGR